MIKHFNLNITEKKSNRINKNTYLNLKSIDENEESTKKQIQRIEYNYDLNMKYFSSLDYDKFSKKLLSFVKKHNFIEVNDLSLYKGISGIYIMVLDEYKQVYIGQSESGIAERIRKHWSTKKSSNRLIFGQVFNSVLSIDSFGALDTTRIFVKTINNPFAIENKYVSEFDCKYLLNRTSGSIGNIDTYTNDKSSALVAVSGNAIKRDFSKFINEDELFKCCYDYEIAMLKNE